MNIKATKLNALLKKIMQINFYNTKYNAKVTKFKVNLSIIIFFEQKTPSLPFLAALNQAG